MHNRRLRGSKQPLKHPFRLIVSARSGSGKSVLFYNLLTNDLYYRGEFDEIYIWDPTAEWDPVYLGIKVTKGKKFEYFQLEDLEKLIVDYLNDRRKGIYRKILFVFDDCGAENGLKKPGRYNNIMDKLAFLARHWKISAIWIVQDICSLSNPVRKNADGFIIFQTLNYQELQVLCQVCGSGKIDEFRDLLRHATKEDYSFLFVHRQGPRCQYFRKFCYRLTPGF